MHTTICATAMVYGVTHIYCQFEEVVGFPEIYCSIGGGVGSVCHDDLGIFAFYYI